MVVETLNGMQVGLGGGGSPSFEEGSYRIGKYSMEERKIRIHRYQQKRTQRNFNKKIKVFRFCLLNIQMQLEFLRYSAKLLIEVDYRICFSMATSQCCYNRCFIALLVASHAKFVG